MIIIGMTISLAGNPKIKAIKITPSKPIALANGSKALEQMCKILLSPIFILAINQIIKPAGAEIHIALFRTNKVRSNIDLIITFPICGLRYGGNSKVNDEGIPFKIVFDSNLEIAKVMTIPIKIIKVKRPALASELFPILIIKNIVIIEIKIGNLPLQGTKLLVKIAISLSLGESMILAPITPTALHPKPMAIVKACLPQEAHFLNALSKLKAILGKYPRSSSKVNSGKKIAIGGNITETTQDNTR